MCGFVGEFDFNGLDNRRVIERLLPKIHHRGPDHSEVWSDGFISMGHARLSIIDLRDQANQPMIDDETGNVIVFNGEIYNYSSLRSILKSKGVVFKSNSDTEVLLKMYAYFGEKCTSYLKGMFAFVIYNQKEKKLFLARDRMGKKPLVYAIVNSKFIFSSEIYPLAHHPDIPLDVDHQAIEAYFSLQAIPSPLTIYKSIRKWPKSSWGEFSASGCQQVLYWQLDLNKKKDFGSYKNLLEETEKVIYDSINLRRVSDVPLGALLSGGVDSSLVAAMLAEQSSEKVKTFSIGFSGSKYDESPYAKEVADYIKSDHQELHFTSEMAMSLIPDIVRHYGEPYADTSCMPTFCVSKLTSEYIKVAMTGDGGDEICAGYDHFKLRPGAKLINQFLGYSYVNFQDLEKSMNKESQLDKVKSSLFTRYLFPEARTLIYSNFFQGGYRNLLLRHESNYICEWRKDLLRSARRHSNNLIDRMIYIGSQFYLSDDLLVKTDIASMAYGLELRSPLLDHEVMEHFASIKPSEKADVNNPKKLLKAIAERWVPSNVIYRPKKGFGIPPWLFEDRAQEFEDILTDQNDALNEYIHVDFVKQLMRQKKHESRLWAVFFFAHWMKSMKEIKKV